jgi:hypothetical protein
MTADTPAPLENRPAGRKPLPAPPPAGELPTEGSPLWFITPKAAQQGQDWIKDDTRQWFEDRGGLVQIGRVYLDHPRWAVGAAERTMRGRMNNQNIVAEVHMLARVSAGLPEFPAGMATKLTVKQLQADTGFQLMRAARSVFQAKGRQALNDFADRAPGQFVKFMASISVPKRIETEVTTTAGALDPEAADALIAALTAELQRRERDMKVINAAGGIDLPDTQPVVELLTAAKELTDAGSTFGGGFRREPLDVGTEPEKEQSGEAHDEWD